MFDDLSEQHIVSLILDSCPYGLKNVYKYKYKYKSSCILHMIRLIPTSHQHHYHPHKKKLCFNHCTPTPHLSMYNYSLLSTGGLCHQPLLPRQRGGLGSFWMWRGLAARFDIGFRAKKINHEFAAYMDWIVNNNYGKIQVKLFTIPLKL